MKKRLLILSLVMSIILTGIVPTVLAADQLKVWVSTGPEMEWMSEVAKIYEERTGVKVVVDPVAELDQPERLSLDGPSGKGADIIGWPHDKLGRAVIQGLLEPIAKYLPENYAKDNFIDSSILALTYDGKLYGLPYAFQSIALVYNKDMYSSIPNTFDAFLNKAEQLTDGNQYGFLYENENFYYNAAFTQGFGGYVFGRNADGSYNFNDIGLGNSGAIKAAKYMKQFRDRGLIPKGTTGDTVNGLFMEEKCGAVLTGPWQLKDYAESGINYGVALMPKLPNGKNPRPFIGVKGYYLSKFSDNKEEAMNFIKFITSAKMSIDHYRNNNIIPPNNALVNSTEFKNNKALNSFLKQAELGIPMPNTPEMAQVWDPAANAMTFVLDGKASAEQVMPMTVQMIKEGIMQMKQ